MAEGEKVEPYQYDQLQTRVDWCGNLEELERMNDTMDQKDHESMYLEDYPEDMPDLEETMSTGPSVYDQLWATPANTTMSTGTEAAGDMFNLSMGPPEMPEPHRQDEPDASHSGAARVMMSNSTTCSRSLLRFRNTGTRCLLHNPGSTLGP